MKLGIARKKRKDWLRLTIDVSRIRRRRIRYLLVLGAFFFCRRVFSMTFAHIRLDHRPHSTEGKTLHVRYARWQKNTLSKR